MTTFSDPFVWSGRQDPEDGPLARRWHDRVHHDADKSSQAALTGFACDVGVARNKGRVGAVDAPPAIRKALANLAWHGGDGMVFDAGDMQVPSASDMDLVAAQAAFGDHVGGLLDRHGKVIVLGGGHETAAGSFHGLLKHVKDRPDKRIGIINLDAHFDLRKPDMAGASSGTPFYQIHDMLAERGDSLQYLCLGVAEISNTEALFRRGKDWGVDYMLDREMQPHLFDRIAARIDHFLADCDYLYLTIDLDVLPHWQMPAVSAPAARGVSIDLLEDIIAYLGQASIPWLLSDLVEFNPALDPDGRAVRVAARLCDSLMRAMVRP